MSNAEQRSARIVIYNFDSAVEAPAGTTLLMAVRSAGLDLDSECAGRGTCGGCRVRFLEGATPPVPEDRLMLGAAAIDVHESWVTDAEYMAKGQASPRGANGSVFAARVVWSKPNDPAPRKATR